MKTKYWHCPYCGCMITPRMEIIVKADVLLEDPRDKGEKIKETITQNNETKYYCADCGKEVEF